MTQTTAKAISTLALVLMALLAGSASGYRPQHDAAPVAAQTQEI